MKQESSELVSRWEKLASNVLGAIVEVQCVLVTMATDRA